MLSMFPQAKPSCIVDLIRTRLRGHRVHASFLQKFLEVQACGTPVFAYCNETVVDGVTGNHFCEQTSEAICAAIGAFRKRSRRFLTKVN
jgi:hypothetical protein